VKVAALTSRDEIVGIADLLEDAWHALLDWARLLSNSRSIEALPFLRELLNDRDTEIWKVALDGLVTLAANRRLVCLIRF
jgi:hypothetical protein